LKQSVPELSTLDVLLRQGVPVRGLTTAAGLWAAAAIGMASKGEAAKLLGQVAELPAVEGAKWSG
jgi:hypothetical protein